MVVNLNTFLITASGSSSEVSSYSATRKCGRKIEFQFQKDGKFIELPVGSSGDLMFKVKGEFGGEVLARAYEWFQVGRGESARYIFDFSFAYNPMEARFANNQEKVVGVLELNFVINGVPDTVRIPEVVVWNRYMAGDEGIPVAALPEYPAPGEVLRRSANLADILSKAAARASLGAASSADLELLVARALINQPLGILGLDGDGFVPSYLLRNIPVAKLTGYIEKSIIAGPGISIVEDATSVTFSYVGGIDYGTAAP